MYTHKYTYIKIYIYNIYFNKTLWTQIKSISQNNNYYNNRVQHTQIKLILKINTLIVCSSRNLHKLYEYLNLNQKLFIKALIVKDLDKIDFNKYRDYQIQSIKTTFSFHILHVFFQLILHECKRWQI